MEGGWRAAAAVLVRPSLWVTALVQLRRLARPGWWRRWPPLPVPDPTYLRFRMVTAYGDPAHPIEASDLVTYLHWCRAWPRVTSEARDGHRKPRPAGGRQG